MHTKVIIIVQKLFHTFISKEKPAEMNIVDITGEVKTKLEKVLNGIPESFLSLWEYEWRACTEYQTAPIF